MRPRTRPAAPVVAAPPLLRGWPAATCAALLAAVAAGGPPAPAVVVDDAAAPGAALPTARPGARERPSPPAASLAAAPGARELEVTYGPSMQPLVGVAVGGQPLRLVFDTSSGETIVFVKEKGACLPPSLEDCYSYAVAEELGTLKVCEENNRNDQACTPDHPGAGLYPCDEFLRSLSDSIEHAAGKLNIDGVEYDQLVVEARENMSIELDGPQGPRSFARTRAPLRLLVRPMLPLEPGTPGASSPLDAPSPRLFEGAGGLLGCSGRTLSCRGETLWSTLLEERNVTRFALDLQPPPDNVSGPAAPSAEAKGARRSRVVLQDIDDEFAGNIVWSQPKQIGDRFNDGMYLFLIYHPEVCGVDLLHNTSSNWLALVDTSGPCLTLPPFLFERLRAQLSISCPFEPGAPAHGQLCSPQRGPEGRVLLPSFDFRLEDHTEPEPRTLRLPLERLVFRDGAGREQLCVARDDGMKENSAADMTKAHIAFGSLAATAFYMVFDLANHTVGLADKGAEGASSDGSCAPRVACRSPMQTYFPPLNVCEDPSCSDYMFMTLDEDTRTCRWSSAAPVSFAALLATLGVLDLISHRLYKQAIEKASEYCQ